MNRRLASLPALALSLAFLGCSGTTEPDAELLEARARWDETNFSNYAFEFTQTCFCVPTAIEPVRVLVLNDVVTGAIRVSDGEALPDEDLAFFSTVDELFDRLLQSAARDPEVFEVSFDSTLGYPTSATIDISFQIADEEYSFTATDLQPQLTTQ